MDLMSSLSTESWTQADKANPAGFVLYTIVRQEMINPGQFRYAVKLMSTDENPVDEDLHPTVVYIEGACGKNNPLAGIRNCELKMVDNKIVGINVEGDCVLKKV